MLRLYLPGRILGELESLQLHKSYHSSQMSLRNGSSEFGDFKRFVGDCFKEEQSYKNGQCDAALANDLVRALV